MAHKPDAPNVPGEPLDAQERAGFAEGRQRIFSGFSDTDMPDHVTRAMSPLERLRAVVEVGMPLAVVERELAEIDLTPDDLVRHGLVPAEKVGLARESGRFDPATSRRLARVVRLVARARITFGDTGRVFEWLAKPLPDIEGATGLQLLLSEEGAALAAEILDSIDHGMAA